jgi:hypothetical protein
MTAVKRKEGATTSASRPKLRNSSNIAPARLAPDLSNCLLGSVPNPVEKGMGRNPARRPLVPRFDQKAHEFR